ncbi:DUF1573 domain-containing protein [Roseiconus lacunae]|uniref:Ig-like domain-containing protein n=1 Tax=Roseiconus lacunae TaxID=2605694 RepID=UPI00308699E0|nr:DUF1573 domain-containing protein [Stieleria sp. HD01]
MQFSTLARAVVFCVLSGQSFAEENKFIPVVLSETVGGSISGRLHFGPRNVGETVQSTVELRNGTSKNLSYSGIQTSCDCTKAKPQQGELRPGESIKLSLEIMTIDRPTSPKAGGMMVFLHGQNPVFTLHFDYMLEDYLGFNGDMVNIELDEDDGTASQIIVPIVVGGSVKASDFEIVLEGLEAEIKDPKIDLEKQVFRGRLVFEEKPVTTKYGKLDLLDLRGNGVSTIPLVLKPNESIDLYPSTLRFRNVDDGKENPAMSFTGFIKLKGPKLEATVPSVRASFGDILFKTSVKQLANGIYQYRIIIDGDAVESCKTRIRKAGLRAERATIRVKSGVAESEFHRPILLLGE